MLQKYGLIFDVDGVIADTEAVNAQASIAMFEELFGIKGVKRRDFEAGLGRGAANYVRAAAEVHGVKLTDEQVESASLKRQENFLKLLDQSPLPAFPGVLELIDSAMNHSSWKLAIATSSTREKSQAVLDSAGIPYKQMVYITGSDVTHKKPHPELFLKAAEGINIKPGFCVVIEDAPNGIESAKSAGCKCVAVTNSAPAEKLTRADIIVESLEQVSLVTLSSLFQD